MCLCTYMFKIHFNIIYHTCVRTWPTHNTRMYVLQHMTTVHKGILRCVHLFTHKDTTTSHSNNEQGRNVQSTLLFHPHAGLQNKALKHSYMSPKLASSYSNASICASLQSFKGFLLFVEWNTTPYICLCISMYPNATWLTCCRSP